MTSSKGILLRCADIMSIQISRLKHSIRFRSHFQPAGDHTPYSSVSTESSNAVLRHSSTTASSTEMDTTDQSINEETRLGGIIESQREREQNGDVSGSESESPHHKAPLTKQDGVDMENGIYQGEKNIFLVRRLNKLCQCKENDKGLHSCQFQYCKYYISFAGTSQDNSDKFCAQEKSSIFKPSVSGQNLLLT